MFKPKVSKQFKYGRCMIMPCPELKLEINASLYDALCSSVGTTPKKLLADDTTLPSGSVFSELTVKVRSMGTNTYIGIGSTSQSFRLTGASQSYTFTAPIINRSVVPLLMDTVNVVGDGATGVLEISGIRVYTKRDK